MHALIREISSGIAFLPSHAQRATTARISTSSFGPAKPATTTQRASRGVTRQSPLALLPIQRYLIRSRDKTIDLDQIGDRHTRVGQTASRMPQASSIYVDESPGTVPSSVTPT